MGTIWEDCPYICKMYSIKKNQPVKKQLINARWLITPDRIDFMAKLLWLDAKHNKYNLRLAYKIYVSHIGVFTKGLFIEQGQPNKQGIDQYLSQFDYIDDIVASLDENTAQLGTPIPVTKDFMALDGAHRISACIYYNKKLPIYYLKDKYSNNIYNYAYFRKGYMSEKYILEMVKKYISLRSCTLWIGYEEKSGICSYLKTGHWVVYEKRMDHKQVLLITDNKILGLSEDKDYIKKLNSWAVIVCHRSEEILQQLFQVYSQLVYVSPKEKKKAAKVRKRNYCIEKVKRGAKKLLKQPV